MIGDEDIVANQNHYQSTVKCLTQHSDLIRIKKEDFIRLQAQGATWLEIMKAVDAKRKKIMHCLKQARLSNERIKLQMM